MGGGGKMGFDQVILYEITIGLSYSGSTGAWGASSLGSIPSSPTIMKVESGTVNKPTVQTMAKIAKALGVSIEELIR